MLTLALDIGSSSVKAAVLAKENVKSRIARVAFKTRYAADRAEVDVPEIDRALKRAIADLGPAAKRVDVIALAVMSPSWLAMDSRGRAITPVVTHQDRRSVDIAAEIEKRVGKARYLKITGNRPFPGGISSTTAAWFLRHEKSRMKRVDLVGHLSTYLIRELTGERVTDPSNASFSGLYRTCDGSGWDESLCEVIGVSLEWLPRVMKSNEVAGRVTKPAAVRWQLTAGTPVLAGCMDTSAAMLLAGAEPGKLINVVGSTDVLAVCTDRFEPADVVLTRAIGVGDKWMRVSTLAAAGTALAWARQMFFSGMTDTAFHRQLQRAAETPPPTGLIFDPSLAGSRTSMTPIAGSMAGITLATTREEILAAIADGLATRSAARLEVLQRGGIRLSREVLVTGGVGEHLGELMHRDWSKRFKYQVVEEATLKGLGVLAG